MRGTLEDIQSVSIQFNVPTTDYDVFSFHYFYSSILLLWIYTVVIENYFNRIYNRLAVLSAREQIFPRELLWTHIANNNWLSSF